MVELQQEIPLHLLPNVASPGSGMLGCEPRFPPVRQQPALQSHCHRMVTQQWISVPRGWQQGLGFSWSWPWNVTQSRDTQAVTPHHFQAAQPRRRCLWVHGSRALRFKANFQCLQPLRCLNKSGKVFFGSLSSI